MSAASSSLFFDRFTRRSVVELQLEAASAIRVGVGRAHDALTTDLPLLRNSIGEPILPGSSLKGVVRSQLEALLRGRGVGTVCDPFVDPCVDDSERKEDRGKPARDRAATWRGRMEDEVCSVCEIFGAARLASHVTFSEARPVEGTWATSVRDGVAIDRDLGRVAGPRKYDFEVVEAGAVFELRVTMENLDLRQEGAVLYALRLIEEGFVPVGGFSSRGLGMMRRAGAPSVKEMTAESVVPRTVPWEDWAGERERAFNAWLEKGEA